MTFHHALIGYDNIIIINTHNTDPVGFSRGELVIFGGILGQKSNIVSGRKNNLISYSSILR